MRVLITGPCGHIGSRLILDSMFQQGASTLGLVLIDNMSSGRYRSLVDPHIPEKLHGVMEFHDMDLSDDGDAENYNRLCNIIRGCDLVINLAAKTDAASSTKESADHNYRILVNVAGACVEGACVEGKTPLIHLSSTSVYGINEGIANEDSMVKPQSPYAIGKLSEETNII